MKKNIAVIIVILMLMLTSCEDSVGQSNVAIKGPYWVENGISLVNNGSTVFED
jgi:hypothetical protein